MCDVFLCFVFGIPQAKSVMWYEILYNRKCMQTHLQFIHHQTRYRLITSVKEVILYRHFSRRTLALKDVHNFFFEILSGDLPWTNEQKIQFWERTRSRCRSKPFLKDFSVMVNLVWLFKCSVVHYIICFSSCNRIFHTSAPNVLFEWTVVCFCWWYRSLKSVKVLFEKTNVTFFPENYQIYTHRWGGWREIADHGFCSYDIAGVYVTTFWPYQRHASPWSPVLRQLRSLVHCCSSQWLVPEQH